MLNFIKFFLIVVVVQVSTAQAQSTISPKRITFCDLKKNKGIPVLLQFTYSGVDEYWSIYSLDKKCNKKNGIDLQFGNEIVGPPEKYKAIFDSVHNSYWNTYLTITAIGIYEDSRKEGYGHLGHNKAKFAVSELIDVKLTHK